MSGARRLKSMVATSVIRPASNTGSEGVITIPSDTKVNMPGNILQVKQTVFPGQFTHAAGRYYQEVEGLRANLTPKFANSSVLISAHIQVSSEYWYVTTLLGRDKPGQTIGTNIEDPNRYGIQFNGSRFWYDQLDTSVPQTYFAGSGQKSLNRQYGAPYSFGDNESTRLGATTAHNKYYGTSTGANAHYGFSISSMTFMDYPNTTNECRYKIFIKGYNDLYQVYVNRSHLWQNTSNYDATPISTITLMEVGGNTNPAMDATSYLNTDLGD